VPSVTDMTIEVILPCLNEAAALPWVLDRLPAGYQALVVDNGSTDDSAEIAEARGARTVRAERRGYGSACHAGLVAATAELVVIMDCDGSVDPVDLPALLRPIDRGEADLVVGRRRARGRGAYPWTLRLANAALARQLRRRTGLVILDCGPVRAARRTTLLNLNVQDRRSGYPVETLVKAAEASLRVCQVDVVYLPRRGRSKVTGTPLGALAAVRDSLAVLDQVVKPAAR
jgi:glycosyltransferase involved in cell wall biosynthesis